MKILLISYNRIGDTILSTGLIDHLLKKYDNASFSIVTSSISACIYQDLPKLDNLIIADKKKYSLHWFKIWNETRKTSWDLVIDLRSSALSYFIRAKKKLIFKGNQNEHKLKQLQTLIGSNNELKPTIWADKKNYINIKHKKKLVDKYICIAPISNAPAKDWHLNKYLKLLENDLFNDFQIILLGATTKKKELIGINYLVQESRQTINNLINNADMIETYFILKNSKLFIGSDSSNMHLAVTANIPTIGLFGPTDEKLYGPLGKNNLSLRGDKSFSEIVNQLDYKSGKIKSYLDDLSVTKVYKEIERILYNK
jgi:ADP-heptose:LPS heptosyltransferase